MRDYEQYYRLLSPCRAILLCLKRKAVYCDISSTDLVNRSENGVAMMLSRKLPLFVPKSGAEQEHGTDLSFVGSDERCSNWRFL